MTSSIEPAQAQKFIPLRQASGALSKDRLQLPAPGINFNQLLYNTKFPDIRYESNAEKNNDPSTLYDVGDNGSGLHEDLKELHKTLARLEINKESLLRGTTRSSDFELVANHYLIFCLYCRNSPNTHVGERYKEIVENREKWLKNATKLKKPGSVAVTQFFEDMQYYVTCCQIHTMMNESLDTVASNLNRKLEIKAKLDNFDEICRVDDAKCVSLIMAHKRSLQLWTNYTLDYGERDILKRFTNDVSTLFELVKADGATWSIEKRKEISKFRKLKDVLHLTSKAEKQFTPSKEQLVESQVKATQDDFANRIRDRRILRSLRQIVFQPGEHKYCEIKLAPKYIELHRPYIQHFEFLIRTLSFGDPLFTLKEEDDERKKEPGKPKEDHEKKFKQAVELFVRMLEYYEAWVKNPDPKARDRRPEDLKVAIRQLTKHLNGIGRGINISEDYFENCLYDPDRLSASYAMISVPGLSFGASATQEVARPTNTDETSRDSSSSDLRLRGNEVSESQRLLWDLSSESSGAADSSNE